MKGTAQGDTGISAGGWDPHRYAHRLEAGVVRYSRGFLRSRPERWFPGIGPQWLPLGHALGVELRVTGAKPVLDVPPRLEVGYAWSADGEMALLLVDDDAARILTETVAPGANPLAQSVVLEYLARRLVGAFARSWCGSESSRIQFESEIDIAAVKCFGAVKLGLLLNGQACEVWVGLGRELVDRLDGLWRRQLRAALRVQDAATSELSISLMHSLQSASAVRAFTEEGEPLELPAVNADSIIISSDRGSVQVARLCELDGSLAFETRSGVPSARNVAPDQVLLDLQIGRCSVDAATLAEVTQIGAVYVTEIPLSGDVDVVVGGEVLARGRLGTHPGGVLLQRQGKV